MLIKNTVSLLQHMVPLEAVLETIKLLSPIILSEPSSLASESEAIPIFPSPQPALPPTPHSFLVHMDPVCNVILLGRVSSSSGWHYWIIATQSLDLLLQGYLK